MAYDFSPDEGDHRVPAVLRAPFEARTWREFGYLLLNLPMGILGFTYVVTMLSLGAGLLVTFLGLPVLAGGLAGCRGIGVIERARARGLLRHDVPEPGPVRARKSGFMSWLGAQLKSGVSWRHALYCFLHFPWAVFTFSVSLTFFVYGWGFLTYPLWRWVFPAYIGQSGLQMYGDEAGNGWYLHTAGDMALASGVGLGFVLVTPWTIRGMAHVDRLMVSGLLGPSKLATRVTELESDRGVVVDHAAADLRRIERDLHDGAQARLVALAMDLGLAKEKLLEDPEAAAKMVGEAHGEVKIALQELRDLARGIHPAILTDRGLDAALSSVAARCTVPVSVTVDLPARPVPAIEGIAYFTVSELLQNISKHSGASRATVDVWRSEDRMMLYVSDNGRGGADGAAGSGLAGLMERLDAVDGVLAVDSPAGGPTRITAELPWRV
ncbi:sensor domain-containing protein [Streptomyces sp. H10-C2]|uniref:sensor histidine kinase n=1 Tax=unclassified Streptomyces TaxID=2593676 RepID=UPI0024B9530E|nr:MULTISPECIES: sensor histidine kinase [unclassified Streptomyces]MDJ0342023.1 sensor domain-containing protein [Streptomyces sp. PH10-H1]MDJ0369996.1 sensor domain-containing protein [Streptomyces sp. H10-C2]MDJ0370003.1 sensor domain-containing protein [Streptomyces sp. H10-C2]